MRFLNNRASAIVFVAACAVSTWANAEYARSKSVLRAFVNANACPSTGLHRLPCPGYVMDHIKALACGGADAVENIQWQTREEAKVKDKWERKECRAIK